MVIWQRTIAEEISDPTAININSLEFQKHAIVGPCLMLKPTETTSVGFPVSLSSDQLSRPKSKLDTWPLIPEPMLLCIVGDGLQCDHSIGHQMFHSLTNDERQKKSSSRFLSEFGPKTWLGNMAVKYRCETAVFSQRS